MLKKLRRPSEKGGDTTGRRSSTATTDTAMSKLSITSTSTSPEQHIQTRRNFFSLPPEIRNAIYSHAALTTRLRVRGEVETLPPTPGLLLASKQTRSEYLPLLLADAPIRCIVRGYDFRNVRRVVGSLYRSELNALRLNRRLTIELVADKCKRENMIALRRWLENRGRGLDRLPWRYRVVWEEDLDVQSGTKGRRYGYGGRHFSLPTSTLVQQAGVYVRRKTVLCHNLEALAQLHPNLEEMTRFDLGLVIEAMETEWGNLVGTTG